MIFIEANINYIDPGTGSYLYQILIAAGIAAKIGSSVISKISFFQLAKVTFEFAFSKLKSLLI